MIHLRQTHWERLTLAREVGFDFDRLSMMGLAGLHEVFHRLDVEDAKTVYHRPCP